MKKILGFALGIIWLFVGTNAVFADDYVVTDINSLGIHNTINVVIEKLNDVSSDAVLIVADYTRDETLKQIDVIPLSDIPLGEHIFNTSICLTPSSYKSSTYDKISVFIWTDIYTMMPLCLPKVRIIEQHHNGFGTGNGGSMAAPTNYISNIY